VREESRSKSRFRFRVFERRALDSGRRRGRGRSGDRDRHGSLCARRRRRRRRRRVVFIVRDRWWRRRRGPSDGGPSLWFCAIERRRIEVLFVDPDLGEVLVLVLGGLFLFDRRRRLWWLWLLLLLLRRFGDSLLVMRWSRRPKDQTRSGIPVLTRTRHWSNGGGGGGSCRSRE
jgi:hypothetical protein